MPLTVDGGAARVKISDDGQVVAFTRGDDLWMVKSDGTEERQLVTAEEFAAMESREAGVEVALSDFEWIPGTHILAFNTLWRIEVGLAYNDDLHLVNADTLERTVLLPPGEGGDFYYSPDGKQVAVVTSSSISLLNADGENRRDVFTHAPVATHSEYRFYVRPVWATDSASLRVVLPPADSYEQPAASTGIWHIPADGTPASLISSIRTGWSPAHLNPFLISPNLRYVAHVHYERSDSRSLAASGVFVKDLDRSETIPCYLRADSSETVTRLAEATIYGWSPDSQHLAFRVSVPGYPTQNQISQPGGDVVPIYDDVYTIIDTVHWVDANRYLFMVYGSRGQDTHEIMLGEIGGPVTSLADVGRFSVDYDFAVSAHDPDAISFGLIYWTVDELWRVNADGKAVGILENPGHGRIAVSPDGNQVLFEQEDDIWLADISTGERRNLTQTPDRDECCAQWWPGQPEAILFNFTPRNEGMAYSVSTMARLDSSGYQVLDDSQTSTIFPALSPDGQTIAYEKEGQARLYRLGTGPEPFDLTPYGLPSDPKLWVTSPTWSPDGRQLAWVISDYRQENSQSNVGVFDLEAETLQMFQPYRLIWSPDGRWMVLSSQDLSGFSVVRTDDPSVEHHLEWSNSPVWSPDGRWLACLSTTQDSISEMFLLEVDTGTLRWFDLPPGTYLVDWVIPHP
jgi:hypothetical protein